MIRKMKNISYLLLSIFSILANYSCSNVETLTNKDYEQARTRFPSITMRELHEGKELYSLKCGSCHFLYKPERHTVDEWNVWIQKMSDKSKATESEQQLILRYLASRSKFQFE